MEVLSIEQIFSGAADFGRKVSATLQRNGDLVSNVYLRVVLSAGDSQDAAQNWAWVRKVGHALISSVELNIGGTKIDKQYGDWMNYFVVPGVRFLILKVGESSSSDHKLGEIIFVRTRVASILLCSRIRWGSADRQAESTKRRRPALPEKARSRKISDLSPRP